MNIANVYAGGMKYYEKAEEFFRRALEGYDAQLGKDHEHTKEQCIQFSFMLGASWRKGEVEKGFGRVSSFTS